MSDHVWGLSDWGPKIWGGGSNRRFKVGYLQIRGPKMGVQMVVFMAGVNQMGALRFGGCQYFEIVMERGLLTSA